MVLIVYRGSQVFTAGFLRFRGGLEGFTGI